MSYKEACEHSFSSSWMINLPFLTFASQCARTLSNVLSIFRRAPNAATPLASNWASSIFTISFQSSFSNKLVYLCKRKRLNQPGMSTYNNNVNDHSPFAFMMLSHPYVPSNSFKSIVDGSAGFLLLLLDVTLLDADVVDDPPPPPPPR